MEGRARVPAVVITQEFLKGRYHYDPGGFFVNKNTGKTVRGVRQSTGYIHISMAHKQAAKLYHRMVWLWHYGELPEQLDHINRERGDNRIENLRACTRTQNQANRPNAERNRSTGISSKGVHFSGRKSKPFLACIIRNGKYRHLGRFTTEQEAAEAYRKASMENDGEFSPSQN